MLSKTKIINGRAGLTLLEILISLSIISVIGLTLYGTFASGIMLNRRSQETGAFYRDARWVIDGIALDLENMLAYIPPEDRPDEDALKAFTGKSDYCSFLTPVPGGLRRVAYYIAEPDQTKVHEVIINQATTKNVTVETGGAASGRAYHLIRETSPFSSEEADEEFIEKESVSRNIAAGGFKIFYGYREDNSPDIDWRPEWEEAYHPAAVTIEIAFINPGDDEEEILLKRKILIPTGSWSSGDKE